jgi:branched-chain amino acid transport system permease protein
MSRTPDPRPAVAPDVRYEVATRAGRITAATAVVACFALVTLPFWGDAADARFVIEVICYVVLAQMWNLLAGYGGLVSIGQQGFVGLGAYAILVFAQHWGLNPFWSIPISGVVAALIAIPIAKLVMRLRGGYFAVGTWVVAEVMRISFSNLSVLGGGSGQSLTVMTQIERGTRENVTYWIACVLLIATIGGMYALLRSRFGLALMAVRDSEAAAESQGIDVGAMKFRVFVLAALGCGLVGALYYLSVLRVAPNAAFDLNWVVVAIFIVVIGGIGTIEGPIVGAAVFFLLRWLLADYGSVYWIAMGIVAIAVMVLFPKGLWGVVRGRTGIDLFPLQMRLATPHADRVLQAKPDAARPARTRASPPSPPLKREGLPSASVNASRSPGADS